MLIDVKYDNETTLSKERLVVDDGATYIFFQLDNVIRENTPPHSVQDSISKGMPVFIPVEETCTLADNEEVLYQALIKLGFNVRRDSLIHFRNVFYGKAVVIDGRLSLTTFNSLNGNPKDDSQHIYTFHETKLQPSYDDQDVRWNHLVNEVERSGAIMLQL